MSYTLTKEERKYKFLEEHPDKAYIFKHDTLSNNVKKLVLLARKHGLSADEYKILLRINREAERENKKIKFEEIISKRNVHIIDLRLKNLTLNKIGLKVNLTRERVRQILKRYGYSDYKRPKTLYDWKCKFCGNEKQITINTLNRRYCDENCRIKSTDAYKVVGKARMHFNKEDWSKYTHHRNFLPCKVVARKAYYERNKEKIMAYHRTPRAIAYFKEYAKRPYVKEKVREYNRRPEVVARRIATQHTPEKRARARVCYLIRMQDPEYAKKHNTRHLAYSRKPEVAEKRRVRYLASKLRK